MIDTISTIRIALRALRVHKMRSGLTMLGIVIGVGAVVAMVAIGAGANQMISKQLQSIGSNLLIIFPGTSMHSGARGGAGTVQSLTTTDVEAILERATAVQDVAPMLSGSVQVISGNNNWSTRVSGTTLSVLSVRDWGLSSGRAFTQKEMKSAAKVCMLGSTVVTELFGAGSNPIGETIRLDRVPFTIIGVLEEKGQTPSGRDQDDTIYIPLTTAQKRLFRSPIPGKVDILLVKARSLEELPVAKQQIESILRDTHRIANGKENDFTVRDLTERMETTRQTTRVMGTLLGAIASVSLLVGGIGIMNIMLVSVTERTREIGIRLAVGARAWDIRFQFLVEAVTLSLIGGAIGIAGGVATSHLLKTLAGWPTLLSVPGLMLAFGFSALVGIFFGFYPAYKASSLEPIEALRYE